MLDLGCNLGELSREARARGAALVDGFEYDPYFIEIGEAGQRLSPAPPAWLFYERDIGDPDVYDQQYDMVLAFAVMGQGAAKAMGRIAEITDVLVLETHRLEGNFEDGYMNMLSRHFPHHRMLGESDWGATFDRHEVRASLVLAKTEEALAGALQDGAVPVLDDPEDPSASASSAGPCAPRGRRAHRPPGEVLHNLQLRVAGRAVRRRGRHGRRRRSARAQPRFARRGLRRVGAVVRVPEGLPRICPGRRGGAGFLLLRLPHGLPLPGRGPDRGAAGRLGRHARVRRAPVQEHGSHARGGVQPRGGGRDRTPARDHERAHRGPPDDLRAGRHASCRGDAPGRLAPPVCGEGLRRHRSCGSR